MDHNTKSFIILFCIIYKINHDVDPSEISFLFKKSKITAPYIHDLNKRF